MRIVWKYRNQLNWIEHDLMIYMIWWCIWFVTRGYAQCTCTVTLDGWMFAAGYYQIQQATHNSQCSLSLLSSHSKYTLRSIVCEASCHHVIITDVPGPISRLTEFDSLSSCHHAIILLTFFWLSTLTQTHGHTDTQTNTVRTYRYALQTIMPETKMLWVQTLRWLHTPWFYLQHQF